METCGICFKSSEQHWTEIRPDWEGGAGLNLRFAGFLIGKRFHIETDHKPLIPPLGSNTTEGMHEDEINLYGDSVLASLPATERRLEEIQTHQDNDS